MTQLFLATTDLLRRAALRPLPTNRRRHKIDSNPLRQNGLHSIQKPVVLVAHDNHEGKLGAIGRSKFLPLVSPTYFANMNNQVVEATLAGKIYGEMLLTEQGLEMSVDFDLYFHCLLFLSAT